ncbi:MAG: hypothetical protein WCY77_02600 [Weeksellaceae bacterium]
MKQIFHKIVSFLMAMVVFFSTMSFTIDLHYCGDMLVDAAIFHKVDTCGMEMEIPSTESCSTGKKDCCNDEQIIVEGQGELQLTFDTLTFEQQTFVVSFYHSYISLFENKNVRVIPFKDYKPPLLIRDIQKLHDIYLI